MEQIPDDDGPYDIVLVNDQVIDVLDKMGAA